MTRQAQLAAERDIERWLNEGGRDLERRSFAEQAKDPPATRQDPLRQARGPSSSASQ